jgi:hypothetical protein
MRSIDWPGLFGRTRQRTAREPGRIARIVELLSRGGVPLDGMGDKKPGSGHRSEPVRWGNFR